MKSFFKKFTVAILSVVAFSCGCSILSACSSNDGNADAAGFWDEFDGVKIAFADEASYNDSEIINSKLVPELNCRIGEGYYTIVDFDIQAQYDNNGGESVTATVQIQPASVAKATIQDTNTGSVSEETVGDITELKATYKIPEKAETVRSMRLVIKIEAQAIGFADLVLTFESSGNIQGVQTSKIEKSAVMGYTEELTYNGSTVIGVSDDTVKSVVIPNYYDGHRITAIETDAFNGLQTIESIMIPDSVTSIGVTPFGNCSGIENIIVGSGNTEYRSENNCLLSKDGNTLIAGCKSSIIPSGVTSIYGGAFAGCSGLTDITLPSGVTSLGLGVFTGCKSLISVTIPDGVEAISYGTFNGCSGLTSVTIPDSVKRFNGLAFKGCSRLKDIHYLGTKGQWYAISKERNTLWSHNGWNNETGDYTVHCTDGSMTKSQALQP